MNNQQQSPKMFCRMCGGQIDRDSKFCPLCGKKLEDSPVVSPVQPAIPTPTQMSTGDQNIQQDTNTSAPTRPLGKGAVIGGICAAVLVLAVIISVAVKGSQPQMPWSRNILMSGNFFLRDDYELVAPNIREADIYTITFLDSLATMPNDAWDVSEKKNRKVMAWAKERNDGGYDLYIGADGGVTAHSNCIQLFKGFSNVKKIQMNGNFHTDNVYNMEEMFYGCSNLTSLDLSGFDTSEVWNMSSMFYGCSNLTSLDLSGFHTENVDNMKKMFEGCNNLTSLDLSGFHTSEDTTVYLMFAGCDNLAELYLNETVSQGQMHAMQIPSITTVYQSK